MLTEVSQLLKRETRTVDTVGRWGDEEFLLVLPGLSLQQAHEALDRLRQAVAAQPFREVGSLTMSAGVVFYRPALELEELLLRADQALYRAKEAGRNQVAVDHDPAVHQRGRPDELLN